MNIFSRPFPTIGLIFMAIGGFITLSVLGIYHYRKKFRERNDTIKTQGYVTKNILRASEGSGLYHPVVRFKTEDGTTLEEYAKVGTMPRRVKENTTITIYYRESNPQKFHIDSKDWSFNMLRLFFVIGSFLLIVGLLMSGFPFNLF